MYASKRGYGSQEGDDKTFAFSLSLALTHGYEPTYTDLAIAHRYAGRGGRCVRTRAREKEFFSVPRSVSVPDTISVAQHRLAKVEEQLIEGTRQDAPERERETRKGERVRHRFHSIPACLAALFFFYFYTHVPCNFCGILPSDGSTYTLPRPRFICHLLSSFLSSRASV